MGLSIFSLFMFMIFGLRGLNDQSLHDSIMGLNDQSLHDSIIYIQHLFDRNYNTKDRFRLIVRLDNGSWGSISN
jgi:hypothetical protein